MALTGEKENEKRKGVEEKAVLGKVEIVISDIAYSKHVDQVICALHSLAVLLFPLDSRNLLGSIDKRYRDEVLGVKAPSTDQRSNWWEVFYRGAAFPTLARVLLFDVASDWLPCFPISARKHVYDVFFVEGRVADVIDTLIPCLQQNKSGTLDNDSVCSNVERLLVLSLLENDGILRMTREFAAAYASDDFSSEQLKQTISRAAQVLTSIPDKARPGAPSSLQSHLFFKQIAIQLLAGAEEWDKKLPTEAVAFHNSVLGVTMLLVGEAFARICRRGSADVLISEVIPQILNQIQSLLLPDMKFTASEAFDSKPGFRFWLKMVETIKDPYAVERMSEQLLRQLATQNATDAEAYWILWILFHQIYKCQTSIRSMFIEKFLLWKVFPVCCLRWILQFAVLRCPPETGSLMEGHNTDALLDTVQHLLAVWSKREFVQSAPMEQQTYITAAVGICLEKMKKKDLDATKDAMHAILQGVSCRLESPVHLVRKMASSVALAFSRVVDPQNPLYLDDSCKEENVDWEFGLGTPNKPILAKSQSIDNDVDKEKDNNEYDNEIHSNVNHRKKKVSEFKLVDPDEVIDPATLNGESDSDEGDDDASENSETSSDSSLQPFDLSDDDTDLQRKFSQLVDVVGALKKSDDADGVEKALDVAEKLVRASPDELRFVSSDLVRALVQVRCTDFTLEGEEESAEEKRQKALVALIVTCPFESLDTLSKLLYSPHVDISQRIMILDVMTDAAQELAHTKSVKQKQPQNPFISFTSENQPWNLPSNVGPSGAGPWKEISGNLTPFNWADSYERELPPKSAQIRKGKTRRWNLRSVNTQDNQQEWLQNKFPQYAAAFMLPAMQGFDKKKHGVDLLGRDFVVLGKLIHMLGVCIKCAAIHPEASALASPLLDMLSSRGISHHVEAYVRRSVLFAASCVLVALNPSYLASALAEGNSEILKGLEWVRSWALHVAESDTDRDCYTMAMTCLQLHAEMSLQASRALESIETTFKAKSIGLSSNLSKGTIKIPYTNLQY